MSVSTSIGPTGVIYLDLCGTMNSNDGEGIILVSFFPNSIVGFSTSQIYTSFDKSICLVYSIYINLTVKKMENL